MKRHKRKSEITPFQVWSLAVLSLFAILFGPNDNDQLELVKGGQCEPPQYVRKY